MNRFFILICMICVACTGEVARPYASYRAFLRFAPVSAAPLLRSALNSPGEWCMVTYDEKTYRITGPSGHTNTYPRTARDAYGKPTSIAGFIVGTPSLPDTHGVTYVAAFDVACPVCYETDNVERSLTWTTTAEQLHCTRCKRTYNLNNGGIIVEAPEDGRKNKSLYRYRATYLPTNDTFVIQN